MAGYDDRDGVIWMDGKLVEWREAKVHILTHALHYASLGVRGRALLQRQDLQESTSTPSGCCKSGDFSTCRIPTASTRSTRPRRRRCEANGLTDAYVRAIAWRGAGRDMGVASRRNPVRLAIAVWEWGAYYGDAKMKGAKLDISKWKRPSPGDDPVRRQGRRAST